MRVLVAPDSFGETMTARIAAEAIGRGWLRARPDDEIVVRPMSDGGPGFIDAVSSARTGRLLDVSTTDPLGRPVSGQVFLSDDGPAYVESAQAAGLHLLAPEERDPRVTSSYGVGALLLAAAEAGATVIYVGLGGSGTNDGGAGMLAAVGIVGYDATGTALPPGALPLIALDHFEGFPLLRRSRVVAASDVDNPLLGINGASAIFGPQKGADRGVVQQLDIALTRFAEVAVRDIPPAPDGLAVLAGGGAAGGLGAAIFALNGHRESGVKIVMDAVRFGADLESAQLVITGEGKFDEQTLAGKVAVGVAGAARDYAVPCVAIAGQVDLGRRRAAAYGFDAEYSMADEVGSVQEALDEPVATLERLAGAVAKDWSR